MKEAPTRNGLLRAAVLACGLMAAALPAAGQKETVDAAAKKLTAAGGLFRHKLFDLAAQEYAEFLAKYPKHKEASAARYGLAICRYRLGRHGEAAKILSEVLRDRRFKQRDEALAVLGHCRLSTKAYDKAVPIFEELLKKYPKSTHAEFAGICRLQALYLAGETKQAADASAEFLKKHPASGHRATAGYYLGLSLSALGEHAKAAAALADLLAKYPNSPYGVDARLLLGQCHENQGDLAAAAEQYRGMIRSAPPARQAGAHYSLGFVLYKAGKYAECIQELGIVLSRYSSSSYAGPARLQLGLAQLAADRPTDARKTLSAVVAKDKTRASRAKYWLSHCDMAQKKYASAWAALSLLSKSKPPPPNIETIHYDMAVCTAALGKHARAAEEFGAFVRRYPRSDLSADATYRQAFALHKLEKYAESLALCRRLGSAKASALSRPASELAAENLFLTGKYAEAAKEFGALSATAGDEVGRLRYRFRLGQCAYFDGDFAEAVKRLKGLAANKKVARDPVLREAIFLLGDAQLQTKAYAPAAESLARYLSLGARRKLEAQYKCALAHLRGGQKAEARKLLAKLAKGPGDSPWVVRATYEYGQLLYDEGQSAPAAKALAKPTRRNMRPPRRGSGSLPRSTPGIAWRARPPSSRPSA